jgi:hypothetical protein
MRFQFVFFFLSKTYEVPYIMTHIYAVQYLQGDSKEKTDSYSYRDHRTHSYHRKTTGCLVNTSLDKFVVS